MEKNKKKIEFPQAYADVIWQTGWVYIKSFVDTTREPFLILDENLKVLTANETFYRTFQVTAAETEKKFIYDLGNGQWASPHLRKLLDDILPKNIFFKDFEVEHNFPIVGHRTMMLNARRVYEKDASSLGFPLLILLSMEDITKQKMLEERLAVYGKEIALKLDERTEKLVKRIEYLESLVAKLSKKPRAKKSK